MSGRTQSYILVGLLLGAIVGSTVNYATEAGVIGRPTVDWIIRNITRPIGEVFLRLLFLTVIPLVFASLAVGVARLGGRGNLGRVGVKTFGYFILTTAIAVAIGLTLVNVLKPGVGLPAEMVAALKAQFGGEAGKKVQQGQAAEFGVQTFVNIIPRNPIAAAADDPPNMLGVIVVALLVGIGSMTLAPEKAELVIRVLEAVGELMVFIIGLAMRIAPMGVFALIFSTTAQFGFGLLQQLGYYVIVVLLGLGVQMVVVFPILLRTLGGQSPLAFFRKCRAVIVTAFSTSSSAATLPTSIKTAEEDLRVPPPIAGFVLPLGATMNMNGTALFEGVTVMFLAQVMGADLSLGQQAVVVVMCVLTAVGAAGVPGGSIPLLAVVLATVGVEPGSIALILGVDRLLDMCRTTLNVLGDLTAAVFVTRSEAKTG